MPQLSLTNDEMFLLEACLEKVIENLRDRIEQNERYVHPAIKYEALHLKLFEFRDNLDNHEFYLFALNKALNNKVD